MILFLQEVHINLNMAKTAYMKCFNCLVTFLFFLILSPEVKAQTSKDIQGTWRVLSTRITNDEDKVIFKMDSSTYNLTKVITLNRVMFTIYNIKTDTLVESGQGKAATWGNQYIETFEQSTSKVLLMKPMVFTYNVQGNKLSYEGGEKGFHIVEVLKRIE